MLWKLLISENKKNILFHLVVRIFNDAHGSIVICILFSEKAGTTCTKHKLPRNIYSFKIVNIYSFKIEKTFVRSIRNIA